ncbi:MAG TPA: hypothetical protein VMA53_14810 [Stellaceae bacterium]|nr:hypothetical protein [Stellaceae bacterium]
MRKPLQLVLVIVASTTLSGCLDLDWAMLSLFGGRNDVRQIEPNDWIDIPRDRAVIVYGVADQGKWPREGIAVTLDEYSMERHQIAFSCFLYNHADAVLAAGTAEVHYFVFRVPPGYYIDGIINPTPVAEPYASMAFEAPAGRIVYIGDFVNVTEAAGADAEETFEFRRNLDAARTALKSYKALHGELTLANGVRVDRGPMPYPCMP